MSHRFNLSASGTFDSIIEYQTLSSGDVNITERMERLHEWLSAEEIEMLHRVFITHPDRLLSHIELREILENLNIRFTDNEYSRLFLKINQNRDFQCDWNEFISYLIFGFQEDDPSNQKEALILPISTPATIRKSEHRSAIVSMSLLKPRFEESDMISGEESHHSGMWLTASREGQIRFWSPHLEPLRVAYSHSYSSTVQTWILAMQALSDVGILCTSSTERELRFHETVVTTFTLRIVIRSMPFAVCRLSYNFLPSSAKQNSKLILGDYAGNVCILEFSPVLRGPFQSKPGAALIELFWSDVLRGKLPAFKVTEYNNIHTEMIQKVHFSFSMNCLFAAAEYLNTKKYRGRCPGLVVAYSEEKTAFRIPLGVTTFFVDEVNHVLITGGPDTFVRIWDVYISSKPSGLLTGHNGGIVMVFVQPEEFKVYSVDYQKVIKVWHLTEHTLLQSYGDLVRLIPSETDLYYHYHGNQRELLIGGRKLISLKCCPRIRVDLTDGNTHSAPVSVVLFNRLFRNVVTCGLDSYIIVWDPWTGRRKIMMKNCHTKIIYGETINIEITAACFDPLDQFLLTGARDGSLKIWNYNNAVCIRNMSIKMEHEVTAVIWVIERILAVGWDQQVTEFNDIEGREYGDAKKWPKFHTDDITCADVKLGEGVVTATYSGEIIFWKLETGQPYRRYNVATPEKFIELRYFITDQEGEEEKQRRESALGKHTTNTVMVRKSINASIQALERKFRSTTDAVNTSLSVNRQSRRSRDRTLMEEDAHEDHILNKMDKLPTSVQAVLFLETRPMTKEHGSVLVALDTGYIQVYSHHQRGGYIKSFYAVHKSGDCVLTMCSDRKNRFLFVGTAFGYLKIWLLINYCIPEHEKVHVNLPLLRLQFIFLRKERFLTRAKRMVRNQPEPMLLSSYKAHLKAINSLTYINLPKIIISGAHDCSCRLWSLGGRYIGTLGTPLPWLKISPWEPMDESHAYRLPPDIKKVASSTTMKVVSGVQEEFLKVRYDPTKLEDEGGEDYANQRIYGKPLRDPILGKHFALPGKSAVEQSINLDTAVSYIPVYSHLKVHETEDIPRVPEPPIIAQLLKEDYMDFYQPKRVSEDLNNKAAFLRKTIEEIKAIEELSTQEDSRKEDSRTSTRSSARSSARSSTRSSGRFSSTYNRIGSIGVTGPVIEKDTETERKRQSSIKFQEQQT